LIRDAEPSDLVYDVEKLVVHGSEYPKREADRAASA
jgi:hypothetical protein